MTDWQPISTAPKDGTCVLLFVGEINSYDIAGFVPWHSISCTLGWWSGQGWQGGFGEHHDSGCPTCGGWFDYPYVQPSHWMPLPNPPKD